MYLTPLRTWLVLLSALLAPTPAHTEAGSLPLLWKASSDTNVVWLYGSIHVGNKSFYPLHREVESAFDQCRVLAMEADPTDAVDLRDALARAGYRPPDRIDDHISPELATRLRSMLPGQGIPLEAARMMKPYLLAMALGMRELDRMGYDAQFGLEYHLAQRARRQGKPILALESMRAQLDLFDALPVLAQEAMLRSTLDSIQSGEMRRDLLDLIAAWKTGNETVLMEVLARDIRDLPPEVRDDYVRTIYDARNETMAARIAEFLRGKDAHFVAVGAGHLPGDKGIVALLRAMGFAVTRVPAQ